MTEGRVRPTNGEASPAPLALIRGAGDLASGVAVRLWRAGFAVVMTEIAEPTPVRRTVAFAEAVYAGRTDVEGIEGVKTADAADAVRATRRGAVAVVVDPDATLKHDLEPCLLVDAIMAKRNLGTRIGDAPAVIALGPGFVAGRDVHAVIETRRGHTLGRVIREGEALPNTGVPGEVGGRAEERLLRAPCAGVFAATARIGDILAPDQAVGRVGDAPVRARIPGVLRGLLRPGLDVREGTKLGDVDPRGRPEHCSLVSDKALAVAGGVLEAACELLGGVRFAAVGADVACARGRRADAAGIDAARAYALHEDASRPAALVCDGHGGPSAERST